MSTPPERPGDAQAQHLFSRSTHLSLGLVEAAMLFSYLTIRDADDRDVPAAAAIRVKRATDFYLGPVLMELALHGRLHMVALLLCLTLLTETFVMPRHLRFPGQPARRKMVSSLYQFLSSPEELTIARQRLQALMQGDQAIAAAIGFPLYDTLLSIRNGVEQSVEAKRQTSTG